MAEYEVKVTPTIEIDMNQLKKDVKSLSGVIDRATKGKIQLELDTTLLDKQAKNIKPVEVDVSAKFDKNSIKAIEKEIRQRFKRINELDEDATGIDIYNTVSKKDYKEQLQRFVEIQEHIKRLIQLKSEYASIDISKLSKDDLGNWNDLHTWLKDFKSFADDTVKDYAEKFNGKKLKLPTIDVSEKFDGFEIDSKVKNSIESAQKVANSSPIKINSEINTEESTNKVNNFIAGIKDKVAELNAIAIPKPTVEGIGSDAKYNFDAINAYNQRANVIRELVTQIEQLAQVSQQGAEVVDSKIISFDKLERMVANVSTQIQHHIGVLEHLNQTQSIGTDIKANMLTDKTEIEGQLQSIIDTAKTIAKSQPITIEPKIDKEKLDETISNVINQGKEAQRRLDELGTYKYTRSEIHLEAVRTKVDANELIEKYKAEGAYSERLTKQLKEERRIREELQYIVKESKKVLSDEIGFTGWDILRSANPSVNTEAFAEYMRDIRQLKDEAKSAEKELTNLSAQKFVNPQEISAAKEKMRNLIVVIESYNQALQSAGTGVTNAFGAIKIPNIEMPFLKTDDIQTQLDSKPPIQVKTELILNNDQIRTAYEELQRVINESNALSQNLETKDDFKAKYDSIVKVQEALSRLVNLYNEYQYGQNGVINQLPDSDMSLLGNLIDQLNKGKESISQLKQDFTTKFGETIVPVKFVMDEAKLNAFTNNNDIQVKIKAIFDMDIPDFEKIYRLNELNLSGDVYKNNQKSLNDLISEMERAYGGKENVQKLYENYVSKLEKTMQDAANVAKGGADAVNNALGDIGNTEPNTRIIESESQAAKELNETWEKHPRVMKDAEAAEHAKLLSSKELGSTLDKEITKTKDFADVLGKMESKPVINADLSGIKFDTRNVDIGDLERQLAEIFNRALLNQDNFKSANVKISVEPDKDGFDEVTRAIATFKDGAGTTVQQIYGLVNVSKEQAETSAAETMNIIDGIAEKAEKQFQYIKTNMSLNMGQDIKFDADHKKGLAEQQIKTIEGQAKGLNLVFDDIKKAAANIVDESTLATYNKQLDLMKEKIKTAKAELTSVKQLDTVSSTQKRIDGFDSELKGLMENVLRLSLTDFKNLKAEDFDKLNKSVSEVAKSLQTFKETQNTLTTEAKTSEFDKLVNAIGRTKAQLNELNDQQKTHKQEFDDYIRTISEVGRLMSELNKASNAGTPDNMHVASLTNQLEILSAKKEEYELTEQTRFSELELAKIQEARLKSAEKFEKSLKSTNSTSVTPKSETSLLGYEGSIRSLERTLNKITPTIDTEGFKRASNEIINVKNALETLREANGTDRQKQAMAEFEAQLKVTKQSINELKVTELEIRGMAKLRENIEQLDSRLDKMEINWSEFKNDPDLEQKWITLKQRVDELRQSFIEIEEAGNTGKVRELDGVYKELNNSISTLSANIHGAGMATKSFADRVADVSKKLSAYLVSFFSFERAISMFNDAAKAVQEIDKAMTALKRVTDETSTVYDKFLTNAYDRAMRLGTSVEKVVNATADFARLGYSLSEAEKLGDAASIYFNVGNIGSDVLPMEEAVQSIISTMKAFGIEAENAMSVVDSFNEVGNKFAISSKGIGDALFRSSSSLAAANNTLDESIGLIIAANNVVKLCHAA